MYNVHVLQNEVTTVPCLFSSLMVWSWRWMSGPMSWEDFCCMVAPSRCTISSPAGRERPGIWRDRLRLDHKSLPWGPKQNSDIITLRPSVLWSGWRCSPAAAAYSWYELAADCGPTHSSQTDRLIQHHITRARLSFQWLHVFIYLIEHFFSWRNEPALDLRMH